MQNYYAEETPCFSSPIKPSYSIKFTIIDLDYDIVDYFPHKLNLNIDNAINYQLHTLNKYLILFRC